jgi:hypothetical protein
METARKSPEREVPALQDVTKSPELEVPALQDVLTKSPELEVTPLQHVLACLSILLVVAWLIHTSGW